MTEREIIDTNLGDLKMASKSGPRLQFVIYEFLINEQYNLRVKLRFINRLKKVYQFFYNKDTVTDPKSKDPAGKIEDFLTV